MKHRHANFKHLLLGVFILAISVFLFSDELLTIFAAPPGSTYSPGETLDPSCAPGDANCSVTSPVTGSGVSGRFTYWNSTSSIASTTGVYWDSTNSRVGIGTSTPSMLLSLSGPSGMGLSLTGAYAGGRQYQIRNSGNLSIVDMAASSSRMQIDTDGHISFGSSTPPSESKLYVYGGVSGANVDVRADNTDESSTMELQRSDYMDTFKSVWLQYSGSTVFGTTLGQPVADSARLVFQESSTSLIYATGLTSPLIFGASSTEYMRITAAGKIGMATTTPATTLQVNGSARIKCLQLLNSDGSATVNYITALDGVLSATTTRPSICE